MIRAFYYHFPNWIGVSVFLPLNLVASIAYLVLRTQNPVAAMKSDALALASAEMGVLYCTLGLVSGSLWGKEAWGIWWTWDARLTSTFVLWLLYVSYLLLRTLIEEPERRALLSALFGIFAFLDVPLVFFSIRWWRTQHPQPVIMGGSGSGLDPTMSKVFFFSVLAMHVLAAFLIVERYVLEKMKSEFDFLAREVEAQ